MLRLNVGAREELSREGRVKAEPGKGSYNGGWGRLQGRVWGKKNDQGRF